MPIPDYVANKNRFELLELLCSGIEPNSVLHLQAESALHVRTAADAEQMVASLEQAIRDATASSNRLGRGLFWLNVVLAAATVVGAFAALWSAFN
jgi:phage-related baseplate assembly protein